MDLDRKAIPKGLAESYRGRGDDGLPRPLLHRDPAIEPVASRFAAGVRAPVPEDGSGLLELVLDSAATMPVAAVDGEPVAVGDGTVHVALPAGRHVVEVQGSGTVSPVVVAVADQEATRLSWREEADRRTVRFGPKVVEFTIPASKVYLYEWAIGAFAVCGVPTGVVTAFNLGSTGARILLAALVLAGLALIPLAPWRRRERARLAALSSERERPGLVPAAHYPWDGPAAADRPALVGERPESLPGFAPGRGALLLRMRAHRHLWKDGDTGGGRDGDGVCVRDAELASRLVPAPRVRIDGFAQPATWGNWWYPLTPGSHVVEVAVSAPESEDRPADLVERIEVAVREGEVAALAAEAHLYLHRGADRRIAADEGRLAFGPEEFRAEWMRDPGKRLAFWG